jgi:hypothetical protein
LTHAYQLEPQGIGDYSNNKVFWAYVEGEADAVRVPMVILLLKIVQREGLIWMVTGAWAFFSMVKGSL